MGVIADLIHQLPNETQSQLTHLNADQQLALVEVLALVVAADGVIDDGERLAFSELLMELPAFAKANAGILNLTLDAALAHVQSHSAEDTVSAAAPHLAAPALREATLAIATAISRADGQVDDSEKQILALLLTTFASGSPS